VLSALELAAHECGADGACAMAPASGLELDRKPPRRIRRTRSGARHQWPYRAVLSALLLNSLGVDGVRTLVPSRVGLTVLTMLDLAFTNIGADCVRAQARTSAPSPR
jgi:hypothetical protein